MGVEIMPGHKCKAKCSGRKSGNPVKNCNASTGKGKCTASRVKKNCSAMDSSKKGDKFNLGKV
jgi:hypothetical protein